MQPSIDIYVNLWNQLKPDVLVDNAPCPADTLQWTFRRLSDREVEARCAWTYSHDPWEEIGTSILHFSLFLETMGKFVQQRIGPVRPPVVGYCAHMGKIQVVQVFTMGDTSEDSNRRWKWDRVFMRPSPIPACTDEPCSPPIIYRPPFVLM